jgi:hypothetical protein
MKIEDLENRFDYHPPRDGVDAARHSRVRITLFDAARLVAEEVPEGRERAMALTKIEEAMFWANAGIARARHTEDGSTDQRPADQRSET